MIARKCDRCGKLYELYSKKYCANEKEFEIDAMSLLGFNARGDICDRQVFYDLCPNCLEEAVSFISSKEGIKSKSIGDGLGGRIAIQQGYYYKECNSCGANYHIERSCCPFCNETSAGIKRIGD